MKNVENLKNKQEKNLSSKDIYQKTLPLPFKELTLNNTKINNKFKQYPCIDFIKTDMV